MAEIYELVLSGPGKNAMSSALMTRVLEQLDEADGRPILMYGGDGAFSAGLNLKEIAGLNVAGLTVFLELLEELVVRLYQYPGPVAAGINGHAIAGGCVAALCADYRVATNHPRARIGLNEIALGVAFPPRTFAVVQARIPTAHRETVLLGADLFPMEEALRLGLVDAVSEEPVEAARAWLTRTGSFVPSVYAQTKAILRPIDLPDSAWDDFLTHRMPSWTSSALHEAIAKILGR